MSVRILSLDLSTKSGWAFFERTSLKDSGLIQTTISNFDVNKYPESHPSYPINVYAASERMGESIYKLILDKQPNYICIESTVRGRNRHTQRLLEWINKAVLDHSLPYLTEDDKFLLYIDPSKWRNILGIKLSNEDKKHNKLVKLGKARGKITSKHLSVKYVNNKFNKQFKLKDNDICDAICVGDASIKILQQRGINV